MKTTRKNSSKDRLNLLPQLGSYATRLYKSVWFFPAILTVLLLILCALKINGSSIGSYHIFLNGKVPDSSILFGSPSSIRSDEWVVATPISLSQYNNGFPSVNTGIGDGQNMDMIIDAPSGSFWQIFRPHNIPFYFLPFDHAFSLKWWIIGYLLIISVYFLVLHFLPGKRLLASLLAISMFFMPIVQWWYQYITLAPIYYGIFIYLTVIKLYNTNSRKVKLALSGLLIYLLVCFAAIFYPAFQISVVIVIAAALLAHLGKKVLSKRTLLLIPSLLLAGLIVVGFLFYQKDQVSAVSNSVYPGSRNIHSGGYNPAHLLASGLSPVFQSDSRASQYSIPESGAFNQSESSNSILLLPFLLAPLTLIYMTGRRLKNKKKTEILPDHRTILVIVGVSSFLLLWLLVPNIDLIGKLMFLNKVPHQRLMMTFYLLNLFSIILIIKHWGAVKIKRTWLIVYLALSFALSLGVGMYIDNRFPLFAGTKLSIVLSLVIPTIVALYLFKKNTAATLLLCLFTCLSTVLIHPLYKSTSILSENEIVKSIQQINTEKPGRWAMENSILENFALAAGAKSITGTHAYPQVEYWKNIAPKETDSSIYNRYANVTINFDREEKENPTRFELIGSDNFSISTEACSEFSNKSGLRYIVTNSPIEGSSGACLTPIREIKTGLYTFTIYERS